MHSVLITFQSAASTDELADPFREYAEALRSVPGLISKTWIKDGNTLGGFHVFESRAEADTYLGGAMVAGLTSNPAFTDFSIDHFDVFDELSRISGTPQRALTAGEKPRAREAGCRGPRTDVDEPQGSRSTVSDIAPQASPLSVTPVA